MDLFSGQNISSLMSSLGGLPDELPWQQEAPPPVQQLQESDLLETVEGLD